MIKLSNLDNERINKDKDKFFNKITPETIEATPRVGMRWRSDFIRGIGRRGNNFLVVLDIHRIFAPDPPAFFGDAAHAFTHLHPYSSDRGRFAHASL